MLILIAFAFYLWGMNALAPEPTTYEILQFIGWMVGVLSLILLRISNTVSDVEDHIVEIRNELLEDLENVLRPERMRRKFVETVRDLERSVGKDV